MKKDNLTLKNLVNSEELAELNIEELMEVQGGMDFDEDLDDCDNDQCTKAAVVYCQSNAV